MHNYPGWSKYLAYIFIVLCEIESSASQGIRFLFGRLNWCHDSWLWEAKTYVVCLLFAYFLNLKMYFNSENFWNSI